MKLHEIAREIDELNKRMSPSLSLIETMARMALERAKTGSDNGLVQILQQMNDEIAKLRED